ncbi:inactive glucose-1-phosphate adenylyltransferase small subunit 2, chloroplastic [Tanacetum coccineum]
MVAMEGVVNESNISSSVIGPRTRVGDGAVLQDSVIIGSDIYQRLYKECIGDVDTKQVNVPIGIGEGSHIKKAIIDKNAKIGRNVKYDVDELTQRDKDMIKEKQIVF